MNCADCKHFLPDKVGDGGIGRCQVYNDYMDKNPSENARQAALIKLGNPYSIDVFWPGDRDCEKFCRN